MSTAAHREAQILPRRTAPVRACCSDAHPGLFVCGGCAAGGSLPADRQPAQVELVAQLTEPCRERAPDLAGVCAVAAVVGATGLHQRPLPGHLDELCVG